MNPFTRWLSQGTSDGRFTEFVQKWDRLERLVIGVYRKKIDLATVEADFAPLWQWLREQYPHWEPALRPYWRATRAAGHPTETDPFALLIAIDSPAAIPGDWRAMQHLPAAREAINRYLIDQREGGNRSADPPEDPRSFK